ncbi:MAG: hypothetical protein KBA47_00210 [Caldisericia bacterium]|nr:hypothetical protein [Caldisericia bacterium]
MKKNFILILLLIMTFTLKAGITSVADDILIIFAKNFKHSGKIGREVIEEGIKKYGDDFIKISKKYGPNAAKITNKYGDEGFRIIRKYGDDGIKAFNNYGDDCIGLLRRYGDDIIEVAAKYDKTKIETLNKYGREIMHLNRKMPREKVIAVLKAVEKDTSGETAKKIFTNAENIVQFIENHPKFFIGVPLTVAIYKTVTNENILKEAIKETGSVTKSTLDTGQKTLIGVLGGNSKESSVTRSIIFSVGFIFIGFLILYRFRIINLDFFREIIKIRKEKNNNRKGDDNNE